MNETLFFIVILLANIVQGITGFAGTILAMPASLLLVGYGVAKPVLNLLGLMSGVYVFAGQHRFVEWREVGRICLVMAVGILCGIFLKSFLEEKEDILYVLLGIFVVVLAAQGLISRRLHAGKEEKASEEGEGSEKMQEACQPSDTVLNESVPGKPSAGSYVLLGIAGIVHGIFVSGGPLVISYLTGRIRDKSRFRATISTVWIILNSIILCDDIRSGLWDLTLLRTFLISIPFLLAGMAAGSVLYRRMSQNFFMVLTYVLLLISGLLLLIR